MLGFIFQQVSLDVMKHRHSFVAIGGNVCTVSLFMTLLTGYALHCRACDFRFSGSVRFSIEQYWSPCLFCCISERAHSVCWTFFFLQKCVFLFSERQGTHLFLYADVSLHRTLPDGFVLVYSRFSLNAFS